MHLSYLRHSNKPEKVIVLLDTFTLLLFVLGVVVVVIIWLLDLQLPVQYVPINIKIVSSYPVHGEVYSIQHYLIKCVSHLRQVVDFLRPLRFPPPIKLTATI